MNWQALLDPDIQKFIQEHENEDIKALALKKPPQSAWPYALIMDQIKASQKAQKKFPHWNIENIIWPSADLIEQASSYSCAIFKASISEGKTFVDLTAGSGIDAYALAQNFENGFAIEKNQASAEILKHNLKVLNNDNIKVYNSSAEDYISDMPNVDLVYIDPQRRDSGRRGIYDLKECSPNIIDLIPALKTKNTLIKTSPVLDIKKAIDKMKCVHHIYVVEYDGDCKELLFLLKPGITQKDPIISAVILNDEGIATHNIEFNFSQEERITAPISDLQKYLYEPAPSILKAGAFKSITTKYEINKLHTNTHLYSSDQYIRNFPGRIFEIKDITQVNKKALKKTLPDMKANLSVRNFPMRVDDLSKKLGLKTGGNNFVFATTNSKNEKILIYCLKCFKD